MGTFNALFFYGIILESDYKEYIPNKFLREIKEMHPNDQELEGILQHYLKRNSYGLSVSEIVDTMEMDRSTIVDCLENMQVKNLISTLTLFKPIVAL